MGFQSEMDLLFEVFNLIGIPFYKTTNLNNGFITQLLKISIKLFLESFFILFGVYSLITCIFLYFPENYFFRLTSVAMSLSTFILRLSVIYKKSEIVKLISELQTFIICNQSKPYVCKKRGVALGCFLNVSIPLSGSFLFMTLLLRNVKELKEDMRPNWLQYCGQNSICIEIMPLLLNVAYTIYFYITPTLCMTLFYFIYTTFEDIFEQALLETFHMLSLNVSQQKIAKAIHFISKATKVHQQIEKVISFSIFMLYVIVFVNFLNLVAVNLMEYSDMQAKFRTAGCIIVFIWTTSCFFKLTMTGSKLVKICNGWRLLKLDLISNCTEQSFKQQDKWMFLLLFLDVSKIDLAFTGWGMFRLDRTLLLTMTEVIISYSVLIITI